MSDLLIGIRKNAQGRKEYLHVGMDEQVSFSQLPQDATVMSRSEVEDSFREMDGVEFIRPLEDKDVCRYMSNKKSCL